MTTVTQLAAMSARDLKAYVTRLPGWDALRISRGLTTASMSKADLIGAAYDLQTGNAPLSPAPAPVAPVVAPVVTPDLDTPEDTPEDTPDDLDTPEPAPVWLDAPADPLASLRGVLSPALLAEADTALSALLASTAATIRAEGEKAREAEAQAARAIDALNRAQGTTPAGKAKPTAFLAPVGTKPLREVLGMRSAGAYSNVPVTLYASPDAMPLDPDFMWPAGSGLLVAALSRGEHVFLYGDAGNGKTTFGEQLSARTGRPYFAISFAGDKASFDLIGQEMPEAGSMVWRDGELLAAMQVPGAIISLEEIGFARSELVSALLSALQGGFINLPGRRVMVAPGVSFLATNNDDGTASRSGRYVGVRPVNGALLDRFGLRFEFEALTPDREVTVLLGRCPGLKKEVARRMVDFRKTVTAAVQRGEAEHGVGLRRLMAWGRHVAAGLPSAEGFIAAVLNGTPADDREYYRQQEVAMLPHSRIDAAQAGTGSLDGPDQPDLPTGNITPERHGFQPL